MNKMSDKGLVKACEADDAEASAMQHNAEQALCSHFAS